MSGGQKQRLALAVNLVADKDIYVFDEATSNIDIESEAIIMDNIKAMSRKRASSSFPTALQTSSLRTISIIWKKGKSRSTAATRSL